MSQGFAVESASQFLQLQVYLSEPMGWRSVEERKMVHRVLLRIGKVLRMVKARQLPSTSAQEKAMVELQKYMVVREVHNVNKALFYHRQLLPRSMSRMIGVSSLLFQPLEWADCVSSHMLWHVFG
jgi:hypothetical protein